MTNLDIARLVSRFLPLPTTTNSTSTSTSTNATDATDAAAAVSAGASAGEAAGTAAESAERAPASAASVASARAQFSSQQGPMLAMVQRASAGATGASSNPSVDVGAMTPEQLSALKKSHDPRERAIATTAERAQKAYGDIIQNGGHVVVSTSPGNGNKPVVTLVPPAFDPTQPARVHTHYHGWNATAADPVGHGSGTTARINEIQANDPQTVFVLPDCANSQPGAYHTDWSNVKNEATTTTDALAAAGIANDDEHVSARVVSAHSAGGFALQRALNAKKDGSGVQADRLELDDCLYGPEKDIAAWAKTPAGQAAKDVVYFHGTNEAGRDKDIARAFAGRYTRVNVPAPKKGDIPLVDGKPKYADDAHNRTVGEFMDSIPGP